MASIYRFPKIVSTADAEEQQAEISRIGSQDAYNWGYDPVHYGVPEGSYATDADSPARLLEYREMVQVCALSLSFSLSLFLSLSLSLSQQGPDSGTSYPA